MGYYLETGGNKHKARDLVEQMDAEVIEQPSSFYAREDEVLVCVVENVMFDAAGICYDEREFEAFADPTDNRPKTWLLIDRSRVILACPGVEGSLA